MLETLICAVCEKEFPEDAADAHITTMGGLCPKCVDHLRRSWDGSEGPGEGGM